MSRSGHCCLRHAGSGARWRVRSCPGFRSRLRGLIGRPANGSADVLHLPRCRAVHTFGMGRAIDVVFCGANGRIVRLLPCLSPWRVVASVRATQVYEFDAGTIRAHGLRCGDLLLTELAGQ